MTHYTRYTPSNTNVYDSKESLADELRHFQWCYIDLKRYGRDQVHQFWSPRVKSLRSKWQLFCEKYREEHGKEFTDSPETLRRLRILHDIHDEENIDYCGPRTLRKFDWTYALPLFTDFIRLSGATGKLYSLRNRDPQ